LPRAHFNIIAAHGKTKSSGTRSLMASQCSLSAITAADAAPRAITTPRGLLTQPGAAGVVMRLFAVPIGLSPSGVSNYSANQAAAVVGDEKVLDECGASQSQHAVDQDDARGHEPAIASAVEYASILASHFIVCGRDWSALTIEYARPPRLVTPRTAEILTAGKGQSRYVFRCVRYTYLRRLLLRSTHRRAYRNPTPDRRLAKALCGLAYTGYSEWLNVTVRQARYIRG
jgi:hypothetical protein